MIRKPTPEDESYEKVVEAECRRWLAKPPSLTRRALYLMTKLFEKAVSAFIGLDEMEKGLESLDREVQTWIKPPAIPPAQRTLQEIDHAVKKVARSFARSAAARGGVAGSTGYWALLVILPVEFHMYLSRSLWLTRQIAAEYGFTQDQEFIFRILMRSMAGNAADSGKEESIGLFWKKQLGAKAAKPTIRYLTTATLNKVARNSAASSIPVLGIASGSYFGWRTFSGVALTAQRICQMRWLNEQRGVNF